VRPNGDLQMDSALHGGLFRYIPILNLGWIRGPAETTQMGRMSLRDPQVSGARKLHSFY
jgi:hypothetical protein